MAQASRKVVADKKIVNENGFERKWFSDGSAVKTTDHPLYKPKGGEKIIFKWKFDKESRNYTRDGYRLRMIGGFKLCRFDGKSELGKKYYYHAIVNIRKVEDVNGRVKTVYDNSSGFTKTVWENPAYPNTAFVEYAGDPSIPIDFPHQNAIYEPKSTRIFVSSAPSVIVDAAESNDAPGVAYRNMRNAGPAEIERHLLLSFTQTLSNTVASTLGR